jgi:hypothetical protein
VSVRGAGRASAAVALCALLVSCDGSPSPRADPGPTSSATPTEGGTAPVDPYAGWLLPNMRSIAASDLQVERVAGQRRLRFAASLANIGAGPMLVVPRGRTGCPQRQVRVRQVVHLDGNGDGVFQRSRDEERRRRAGGCMLDHPTHDHWHFDAMAAYTLTVPGTSRRVSRDKVSFCLRDNERAPGRPRTVRRAWFGECSATGPQGISPGWVDVYRAELDGQWLRVPPGIEGRRACLTLEADPADLLLESDETDNATSIPIRITGTRVRRLAAGC